MSLNTIQLNAQLLADLYPDVLVETKAQQEAAQTFEFFGENKRNILIIVAKEDTRFLADEELQFLKTVLSACKLTVEDIAIINYLKLNKPNYIQLKEHFKSNTVMLFDVSPLDIDLPFYFPHFQIQQSGGIAYLSAPSLKEIEKDKGLKTKLWMGLKQLFTI